MGNVQQNQTLLKKSFSRDLIRQFVDLNEPLDAIFYYRELQEKKSSFREIGELLGLSHESIRNKHKIAVDNKTTSLSEIKFSAIVSMADHIVEMISPFMWAPNWKQQFGILLCFCNEVNETRPLIVSSAIGDFRCNKCKGIVKNPDNGLPSFEERISRFATSFLGNELSLEEKEMYLKVFRWCIDEKTTKSGNWIITDMNCFEDLKNRIPNDLIANIEKMTNGLEQSPYDQTTLDELISYLLNEAGFLRYEGPFWIRGKNVADKSFAVLTIYRKPLTLKELSGKIGRSANSIQNVISNDDRFMRLDANNRYGLTSWGMEEYSGIHTEIVERIERGNGKALISALISEFTTNFGVSETSVRSFIASPSFLTKSGWVYMAIQEDYVGPPPKEVKDSWPTNLGWGMKIAIKQLNFEGYSFLIHPSIGDANGIYRGDSYMADVLLGQEPTSYQGSIIWPETGVADQIVVGRLSQFLKDRSFNEGDEIIIVPTPTAIYLFRHPIEKGTPPKLEAQRAIEVEGTADNALGGIL